MKIELSRRRLLLTAALAPAAIALTGCGADANQRGRVRNLTYAQSVPITSLATAGNQPEVYPAGYEAAFALYSGLVRLKPNMSFEPDLATEWSNSKDGRTWIFKLRDDVQFHDGTPFDADAVVAYFTRMLDDTYNVAAYALWEPISDVTKDGSHTVALQTTAPYAALLNTLAHGSGLIPSPALAEAGPEEAKLNPIGTGPYKLKDFNPGSSLDLESNSAYHGSKPSYDTISFTYVADSAGRVAALSSGQAHVIDAVPVQQAKQLSSGPNRLTATTGLQTFGIGLVQVNPLLRDPRVRQALNMAIDVDAIVAALFRGYATALDSPLARETGGHATVGQNTYDPDQAKELLKQAGLEEDADGRLSNDGEPVSLRLRCPEGLYANDTLVAQAVQDQFGDVGVEVTIQKVDEATFWDSIKVAKSDVDFDLVLFGFNPSHGSGALQLDIMYRSNTDDSAVDGWNFNWYSNPEVDDGISTALRTVESDAHDQVLAKVQETIWNDAPYVWLYVPDVLTAYTSPAAEPLVLPVSFTLPSRAA